MYRHKEKEVPEHPCLEFISNSEEKLQTNVSRRLITMRKVKEYEIGYVQLLLLERRRNINNSVDNQLNETIFLIRI